MDYTAPLRGDVPFIGVPCGTFSPRSGRDLRIGGELAPPRGPAPVHSGERGEVAVTVTTYGLGDAGFEAVHRRWAAWWRELAADSKVTP